MFIVKENVLIVLRRRNSIFHVPLSVKLTFHKRRKISRKIQVIVVTPALGGGAGGPGRGSGSFSSVKASTSGSISRKPEHGAQPLNTPPDRVVSIQLGGVMDPFHGDAGTLRR